MLWNFLINLSRLFWTVAWGSVHVPVDDFHLRRSRVIGLYLIKNKLAVVVKMSRTNPTMSRPILVKLYQILGMVVWYLFWTFYHSLAEYHNKMPRHDTKKSCIYIGRKTLYDKQAAKHKKKFQGPTLIINVNKKKHIEQIR